MRQTVALLFALLLLGCNQQKAIEKFSTPADQAIAKGFLADLQARRFEHIESNLDAGLKPPNMRLPYDRMASFFPAAPPTSVKLVGAYTLSTPTMVRTNTTFEYQWGDRWVVANVAMQKTKTSQTIIGINVEPENTSLEAQNRFTLAGKTPAQYAILAAAVLALALTLYALAACIRAKGLTRKWAWIVFILFGFGALSTNWTTGAVGYRLLSFNLFSASAFSSFYGPWTIAVSLPLGALLFLFRRLRGAPAAGPEPAT